MIVTNPLNLFVFSLGVTDRPRPERSLQSCWVVSLRSTDFMCSWCCDRKRNVTLDCEDFGELLWTGFWKIDDCFPVSLLVVYLQLVEAQRHVSQLDGGLFACRSVTRVQIPLSLAWICCHRVSEPVSEPPNYQGFAKLTLLDAFESILFVNCIHGSTRSHLQIGVLYLAFTVTVNLGLNC